MAQRSLVCCSLRVTFPFIPPPLPRSSSAASPGETQQQELQDPGPMDFHALQSRRSCKHTQYASSSRLDDEELNLPSPYSPAWTTPTTRLFTVPFMTALRRYRIDQLSMFNKLRPTSRVKPCSSPQPLHVCLYLPGELPGETQRPGSQLKQLLLHIRIASSLHIQHTGVLSAAASSAVQPAAKLPPQDSGIEYYGVPTLPVLKAIPSIGIRIPVRFGCFSSTCSRTDCTSTRPDST